MRIASKTLKAVTLVKEALAKARQYQHYNIFTFLDEQGALARAQVIDQRIARGEEVGLLAGVPYALKDNFLSPIGPTTACAELLQDFQAPITATAVAQLEAAGAIMLGRTNMDAFAHGSSTENSYFGVTKNAIDPTRVAGGSSGGSAGAVALDIVQFATGTDTGGSIRQPAAFNGVLGIKPTYGAISRYGVVAMASSTDCVGFFAKTAADLDLLMSLTAQHDSKDSTSLNDFYQQSPQAADAPTRIGIITDFAKNYQPSIATVLSDTVIKLQQQGCQVVELNMPELDYALAVYYTIVTAEIASNLARYNGVFYGKRAKHHDLTSMFLETRTQGFMPENKRRILIGNFILSAGFYDAYFLKAAKVRTLIIQAYQRAFTKCDYLLTPVCPSAAFPIGAKTNDPIAMYMEDIMSTPINLAGLPAVAFPVGQDLDRLPLGLQLVGPRKTDRALLHFIQEHLC